MILKHHSWKSKVDFSHSDVIVSFIMLGRGSLSK